MPAGARRCRKISRPGPISIPVPASADDTGTSGSPTTFQSTCPVPRLFITFLDLFSCNFNPRAGVGRRADRSIGATDVFHPRARVGHDSPPSWQLGSRLIFNPRARRGHDSRTLAATPSRHISILRARVGTTIRLSSGRSGDDSIHVPAWGIDTLVVESAEKAVFQSTCPVGHDCDVCNTTLPLTNFKNPLPRGHDVDRIRASMIDAINPRPRGARQDPPGSAEAFNFIHVPRGARRGKVRLSSGNVKFQSTCPWGRRSSAKRPPRKQFQSMCPAWGNDIPVDIFNFLVHISIHFLAWGTTIYARDAATFTKFQSTCPRGARLAFTLSGSICALFQSTCPRGARRRTPRIAAGRSYFNPRARVGQTAGRRTRPQPVISNPRARVGRRRSTARSQGSGIYFKSTAAWGTRSSPADFAVGYFHTTARWGTTARTRPDVLLPGNFNPRAAWARLEGEPQQGKGAISIHVPAWGTTFVARAGSAQRGIHPRPAWARRRGT